MIPTYTWAVSDRQRNRSSLHELVGFSVGEAGSGSVVEKVFDVVEVAAAVDGQVGALREVLPQQAVDVLVAGPLPGTVRVGEVDLDVRVHADLSVQAHLLALVPGQRLLEVRRPAGELRGQRGRDLGGGVSVRQVQQPQVAGGALHHGADRRLRPGADDQVSFEMAGEPGAVGVAGRGPVPDRDHAGDPAAAGSRFYRPGLTDRLVGPGRRRRQLPAGLRRVALGFLGGLDLPFQPAAGLQIQRPVDRLVMHAHLLLGGVGPELAPEPAADLLRREPGHQIGHHPRPQP